MAHTQIPRVCYTRPLGSRVVIRARDDLDPSSDLFKGTDGKLTKLTDGVGRTILTALPDHVGVCEVVEVGSQVTNVKKGDVCMIDFHEVEQPYVVDAESLYLCPSEAFRCLLDGDNLAPLPDYVVTKSVPQRMSLAYSGDPSFIMPDYRITGGYPAKKIWSHAKKAEVDCFFIVYEEVVGVGSRIPDVAVGDLVALVTDFSMRARVRGEYLRVTPAGPGLLATVDDRAILEAHRAA